MEQLKYRLKSACERRILLRLVMTPAIITYRAIRFIRATSKMMRDRREYVRQCGRNDLFSYHRKNSYTILYDYLENAGTVNPHYFLQDVFVANKVFSWGIKHIYDIGSRLDGYISHLLSMGIRVTMIDIRPLPILIDGLDFLQGDAMSLDGIEDGSIPCLSCLHALEHFGLGRYGDPVDYEGWGKALHAIVRKLAPEGLLFLSVPVGGQDLLMYNAHRIFRPVTIFKEVKGFMTLLSFTLVKDYVVTTTDFSCESAADKELSVITDSLGQYDCGIFVFKRMQ